MAPTEKEMELPPGYPEAGNICLNGIVWQQDTGGAKAYQGERLTLGGRNWVTKELKLPTTIGEKLTFSKERERGNGPDAGAREVARGSGIQVARARVGNF